jgi:hypothetical protein
MKWLLQYFGAPLLAAIVALYGNYLLVQKPLLNKEYTKLGLDIMLQKDAPFYLRRFGQELLNQNSPVELPESEREEKLEELLRNIPSAVFGETITAGDLTAAVMAFSMWTSEVRALCEECINEGEFKKNYAAAKKEILSIVE